MRVFKFRRFARYARKASLSDLALLSAATNVISGKVDADLGGGVIKQRIARPGSGKSGGFRTILLFRAGSDVFFVHGFAKNDVANITAADLVAFRKLAAETLSASCEDIDQAVRIQELIEVSNDG